VIIKKLKKDAELKKDADPQKDAEPEHDYPIYRRDPDHDTSLGIPARYVPVRIRRPFK
jgi:hypothetical protein